MRNLWLWGILWMLSVSIVFPADVYACGGGFTDNIQLRLERTDVVVKADIVSVDDVRQNALLAVESYLYGGAGASYLLFVQNDPLIVTRMIEGDPIGNCNFFQPELIPGTTGYFFLERRADGAYVTSTFRHDPNYITFPDANSTITLYSQDPDNNYIQHDLTESDFIDFVTTFGESSVMPPDEASQFLRLAPLKITTEDGTDYLLPIDNTQAIAITEDLIHTMTMATTGYDSTLWNEGYFNDTVCPGEDCVQVSPQGINRAQQQGDRIYWLGGDAIGQAFQFSSTGDVIAIWNENHIEFYTLGWQKYDQPFHEVTLLNEVTVKDSILYESAWSPNGRIFSYSDADGLWAVDVYDPSIPPQLLVASDNQVIPRAIQYSPLGRYLQVQQGDMRYILDTVSGAQFPDGIVSPDDRVLLAYDTQAEEFDIELCYLAPVRDCATFFPLITYDENDNAHVYDRYRQIAWRNVYSFLVAVCEHDNPDVCIVNRIENRGGGGLWYNSEYSAQVGYGFDYMSDGDVLVVMQDATTIQIADKPYDLSTILDSSIASVEWLPSLFYQAR